MFSLTRRSLQIELWTKNDEYDNEVYRLPKHLDEKVAFQSMSAVLGGHLTKLRPRSRPNTSASTSRVPTSRTTGLLECSTP